MSHFENTPAPGLPEDFNKPSRHSFRFRNLVTVLEGRGWGERNIELLLGKNWLRLFAEVIG